MLMKPWEPIDITIAKIITLVHVDFCFKSLIKMAISAFALSFPADVHPKINKMRELYKYTLFWTNFNLGFLIRSIYW